MNADIRAEFPILQEKNGSKRLAYLDNAASVHKPLAVMAAMDQCLKKEYSNIHRGVHWLSQRLTQRYETVREKVASFLHAERVDEIIFTKGTTDSLNLLASSLSELLLKSGDKVLITAMEHHANIVPWQIACRKAGAQLVVLPMDERGVLEAQHLPDLLSGVKIFSITQVSNALGTINPVKALIQKVKAFNPDIVCIVDGAQVVAHLPVDVQDLGCDFYAFSAHKLYGPTAVGVLYGRYDLLEAMPPYQSGGDMILSVSFEKTSYAPPPHKFEAGTPPIVEVIGLGAAIDWVQSVGLSSIQNWEQQLHAQAEKALMDFSGVRIYGTAPEKAAVISFTLNGIHPHDAGTIFDAQGVAVRVGHHCAEPVMRFFHIPATIRASFAVYNDEADVAQLLAAVRATQEMFA